MLKALKNRKGQGTTEYIVILGIVVAIAMYLVWGKLQGTLNTKVDNIATQIGKTNN